MDTPQPLVPTKADAKEPLALSTAVSPPTEADAEEWYKKAARKMVATEDIFAETNPDDSDKSEPYAELRFRERIAFLETKHDKDQYIFDTVPFTNALTRAMPFDPGSPPTLRRDHESPFYHWSALLCPGAFQNKQAVLEYERAYLEYVDEARWARFDKLTHMQAIRLLGALAMDFPSSSRTRGGDDLDVYLKRELTRLFLCDVTTGFKARATFDRATAAESEVDAVSAVQIEVPLEYAYADERKDPLFVAAATDATFKAKTRDFYSTIDALQRVSGRNAARPKEPYDPPTRDPELIEQMAEMWYHLKANPSLERVLAYLRFHMDVINYLELNLKLNNPDILPRVLAQSVLEARYNQTLSIMEQVKVTKGVLATEADFAEEAARLVALMHKEIVLRQKDQEEQEQAARQAAGQAPAPVADPLNEKPGTGAMEPPTKVARTIKANPNAC